MRRIAGAWDRHLADPADAWFADLKALDAGGAYGIVYA
jgi:hypothetical protein